MFSKQANYSKLKTNLRLVINRLKLLEKKKTELALKSRKEIADYIKAGKDDRARIKVEHIIREDYMVEAMEMIEMYCDLLLARFGLISSQKDLDPGLEEAVATLIWVTPRLQTDVAELKPVAEQLSLKYSKEFAAACLSNVMNNVNERVTRKLSVRTPSKSLVEQYMTEIAKSYGVPFEPDEAALAEDDLAEPALAVWPEAAAGCWDDTSEGGGLPCPQEFQNVPVDGACGGQEKESAGQQTDSLTMPELPAVPRSPTPGGRRDLPQDGADDNVDLDDLTRRFAELKKRN